MEPALRALRGGFEKLDEDLNFLEQKLDAEFSKTVSVAPTRRRSKSSTVACPAKLLRKLDRYLMTRWDFGSFELLRIIEPLLRLERDIQNLQVDAAQVAVAKKVSGDISHCLFRLNRQRRLDIC